MDNMVDAQARRVVMHEFRDGTADMAMGMPNFGFALCMALGERLNSEAIWLAAFLAINGAVLGVAHLGTRTLRARLVYQRSGYVQRRRPRPAVAVGFLLVVAAVSAGVAGLMGYLLVRSGASGGHLALLSAPLIVGMGVAAAYLFGAMRVRRFAVYAAISAGLGVGLHVAEPSLVVGGVWYFTAMGVAMLVGGAITLCLFVRRTPVQSQEVP